MSQKHRSYQERFDYKVVPAYSKKELEWAQNVKFPEDLWDLKEGLKSS